MKYKQLILKALDKVVSEPGYLDDVKNRNIHEQALAHRLAYHLENSGWFVGYMVDCEYNRHGADQKTDESGKCFRPDIVIHVRGNDDDNLIMIETKKYYVPRREEETAKTDLANRSAYYCYRMAFLVIFPENEITEDSVTLVYISPASQES